MTAHSPSDILKDRHHWRSLFVTAHIGRYPVTQVRLASEFDPTADFVLYEGDCLDLLPQVPAGMAKLVVTSPPYNLGKPYESRLDMAVYLDQQRRVIRECARVLYHLRDKEPCAIIWAR